jgi:hypothetical protein
MLMRSAFFWDIIGPIFKGKVSGLLTLEDGTDNIPKERRSQTGYTTGWEYRTAQWRGGEWNSSRQI